MLVLFWMLGFWDLRLWGCCEGTVLGCCDIRIGYTNVGLVYDVGYWVAGLLGSGVGVIERCGFDVLGSQSVEIVGC